MRLKEPRISVTFMALTGSISVGLVGLHIHKESAGSAVDPTASSLSEDRSSRLGDVIGNRREYEMMLSVLQLIPLSPFFFPSQKWRDSIFLKLISVSYFDERRVIKSEKRSEIESSIFSRRMEYLNKRYLLIFKFVNGDLQGRTQLLSLL